MTGVSLLDVLRGVMLDPAEQAVYEADPAAYLQQYGYEGVDPADLSEAFGLVADTLPADQALGAYTGGTGPEVPTMGGDTTDFDIEPAADLGEGGPVDELDAVPGPDDDHDVAAHGGEPDIADDLTGDFTGDIDGGFGDGDDTPGIGTDLGGDAPDLSFGRGVDVGEAADTDLAAAGATGADDAPGDDVPAVDAGLGIGADDAFGDEAVDLDDPVGHGTDNAVDSGDGPDSGDTATDLPDVGPDDVDIGSF